MQNKQTSVLALAGGVGAAKFLLGLHHVIDPDQIHILCNTGDDCSFFGLHISPDIDIVLYTLAGLVDPQKNWGIAGDTFTTLDALKRYYDGTWFNIGDKDLATHLFRTDLLNQGFSLTKVTQILAKKLGLKEHFYPMSDSPVPTILETDHGRLEFQEYFVKHQWIPEIKQIINQNVELASLPAEITAICEKVDKIIICPSNPFISVGPILSIPKMKELLQRFREKVWIISPIVEGQAIKGPTRKIMDVFQIRPDAIGIAELYRPYASNFILDERDASLESEILNLGYHVALTDTIMSDLEKKTKLASFVLKA